MNWYLLKPPNLSFRSPAGATGNRGPSSLQVCSAEQQPSTNPITSLVPIAIWNLQGEESGKPATPESLLPVRSEFGDETPGKLVSWLTKLEKSFGLDEVLLPQFGIYCTSFHQNILLGHRQKACFLELQNIPETLAAAPVRRIRTPLLLLYHRRICRESLIRRIIPTTHTSRFNKKSPHRTNRVGKLPLRQVNP